MTISSHKSFFGKPFGTHRGTNFALCFDNASNPLEYDLKSGTNSAR